MQSTKGETKVVGDKKCCNVLLPLSLLYIQKELHHGTKGMAGNSKRKESDGFMGAA